jgi:multidrug efflux pump subunit AcrB
LALTIAFALIMSFFVSRTVTPLLCMYLLRVRPHGVKPSGFIGRMEMKLDQLDHGYARSLGWVLRHRAVVIAGILAVFVGSLFLKSRIGTEFFPDTDEAQFNISYKTPIGTRVEQTEKVTQRIEAAVEKALGKDARDQDGHPLYTTMISDSGLPGGRSALFSSNTGPHAANINVNLVSKNNRKISDQDAAERVRAALRDALPGTQSYYFVGGIVKRILNFGSAAPIDVEILGYDLQEGASYARTLLSRLRSVAGSDGKPLLTDLQISREENYPELDVVVDRQKAGVLGLSEQTIAQTVLSSLVGNTQIQPIQFTDPKTGNEYYINVRLDDAYRRNVSDLKDVFLRTPSGKLVSLDTVASVERGSGPVLIERKYLQRIIHLSANVAPGRDLGSVSAATQKVVDEVKPPEGFTARLGGQTEAQKAAFKGLAFAGVMALALVYMVLAAQFRSLIDPLVIMFSVPLGITGVFIMLWLTGTTLSVNSAMGIIMMVGIVVSNGVLLVDFANQLRDRGHGIEQAMIEAGRTRLRPILMTTIATIFGLIPMALGIGEGSETNLPLARAVIGGLAVSTFFTLFLVPALYTVLDRFARRTPDEDAAKATTEPIHA